MFPSFSSVLPHAWGASSEICFFFFSFSPALSRAFDGAAARCVSLAKEQLDLSASPGTRRTREELVAFETKRLQETAAAEVKAREAALQGKLGAAADNSAEAVVSHLASLLAPAAG